MIEDPTDTYASVDAEELPGVAIIGMAARVPGARNLDEFRSMIFDGREGISRFQIDELEIDIEGLDQNAAEYVCAKGLLPDVDKFDARFFDYLPKEAEVMDPQHRVFLELCSETLDMAGCDPSRFPGSIGVFAGCYFDTYVFSNLCSDETFRRRFVESIQVGSLQTELGNDKDYLATRVAYKLGLTGPAMTLQTACSTSLVAIANACQAIESYSCDAALVGGVTIVLPQRKGYFYKEGGMLSPDGKCRPFDKDAAGTVFSNGAGVVLLKRLDDAIRDKDQIFAVIRGYATNNDGGDKVSYTAPSVEGQANVISMAIESSGIDPSTIGYVEAHGTATPIGDPIEVSGLKSAFQKYTSDTGYCAIGSVKANLGHLDVASGVVGLIKTATCLRERTLPGQINFDRANPKIDFATSPFYVNTETKPWVADSEPRRAAISSFGVGGTNAHIIVEEWRRSDDKPEGANAAFDAASNDAFDTDGGLVLVSAKTEAALTEYCDRISTHFEELEEQDLQAAAWTTQTGRRQFDQRRWVFGETIGEISDALIKSVSPTTPIAASPRIVFVFSGQGAQVAGMSRVLFDKWPAFRAAFEVTVSTLSAIDRTRAEEIERLLLASPHESRSLQEKIAQTSNAQPAIVCHQIAMAEALKSWGVSASALIGHSVGEFSAAYLAGIFSLHDTLAIVMERGRLMQAAAAGAMLAVRASEEQIKDLLDTDVDIAAVNSPSVTVVSGDFDAIGAMKQNFDEANLLYTELKTSHAFHSRMMARAATEFVSIFDDVRIRKPNCEVTSTVDAGAPRDALCTAEYWTNQITSPVRFANAVVSASSQSGTLFVELGPGNALTGMMQQSLPATANCRAIAISPSAGDILENPDSVVSALFNGVGACWGAGVDVDWSKVNGGSHFKTDLPSYPLERKSHWIEPTHQETEGQFRQSEKTQVEADDTTIATQEENRRGIDVESVVQKQLDIVEAQIALLKRGSQ